MNIIIATPGPCGKMLLNMINMIAMVPKYLLVMSCYPPLFVNVNTATATAPKAWQWDSDLIGYNALNSYGSPSYYVQKLFSQYLGDKIVPVAAENIPTQNRPLTRRDSTDNITPKPVPM